VAVRADDIDVGHDRVLVEAWQAGDGAAFDDLYLRHFDRLRAYCQRRVQNPADAEEIAQEAFVKALQALPRLEGERRFYPWVSVIANRLCIDHHRRLARVRPSDDVDPGTVDDEAPARLALQADIDHLDQALRRLGPRHAEVLDLRERRGMSYHEIAEHLDVPHSTVETLLFRARKALRREFAAVSGERLAGFPVVGWLALRMARLRERVGDAAIALTGPVAAGAVVAVAGLVASPPPADVPATVTTVEHSTVAAEPPLVEAVAPVLADLDPAPGGPSSAAPTPAPRRPSEPVLSAAGVEVTDRDGARSEAEEMPVLLDVGDVGVGLDPGDVVIAIRERLTPGGDR
jgi:RNA polymerase sigma-70 factor, ECF subfamily